MLLFVWLFSQLTFAQTLNNCVLEPASPFLDIITVANRLGSKQPERLSSVKASGTLQALANSNCAAPQTVIRDTSERARSGLFYTPNASLEKCLNFKVGVPLFKLGGKARLKDGTVDLFPKKGNPKRSLIDCSGMISASCALAGERIMPGRDDPASYDVGTHFLLQEAGTPRSCFDRAQWPPKSGEGFLSEGDVIVLYGHAVQVTRAGADPFGLSKTNPDGPIFKSEKDCTRSNFSFSALDFDVRNSMSYPGRVGIATISAEVLVKHNNDIFANEIVGLWEAACKAKFKSEHEISAELFKRKSRSAGVVRHSARPECLNSSSPYKLVGSQCLEDVCGI